MLASLITGLKQYRGGNVYKTVMHVAVYTKIVTVSAIPIPEIL
jgi:hypothetical protein